MKHFNRLPFLTLLMICFVSISFAQTKKGAVNLGTVDSFKSSLEHKIAPKNGRVSATSLQITTPDNANLDLKVKYQDNKDGGLTLVGNVNGKDNSSFVISFTEKNLHGNIILKDQKKAYEYVEENGSAFIVEKDINKVLCIEYDGITPLKSTDNTARTAEFETAQGAYDLQSLPGAEAVVLLDFDGYQLPAGTGWLDGRAWYAPASGMSDAQIQEAWEIIAEDYRPYNINITTSQAVHDSYPVSRRVRCVFTPANDPAPGAGGVAFVGWFGQRDWPCWVFMMDGKVGGEAASHEIGHTVGLGHDGRTNPDEGYFLGHGDWAPIMGAGYYKPISQWSRGEYAYANNQEDDLGVMDRYIRRRGDDHGNDFGSSSFMDKDAAGNVVTQYGVITGPGDMDMFRFTCGTGNVSLDINTVGRHGDLDVLVNLYEGSTGNLIGVFNGGGLNTHLDAYLDAGTYYLGVDGTGAGDPATNGYTDYASLGSFWITGVIPAGGGGGGDYLSWEAINQPGKIIRHMDSRGRIDSGVNPPADGNWKMVPGLAGTGVSFQSMNFPDRYLRHRGGEVWLDTYDGSDLFKNDATFMVRNGLADGSKYSFESYNFPGNFIRHRDSELFSEPVNDALGRSDATFNKLGNGSLPGVSGTSIVIEAENFTSMSGVQTESCSEGGSNVGYIETGDWMAYTGINFPNSGNYKIEYRVASETGGGVISADLNAGSIVLGTVNVPATGGWQTWSTVSHTVRVDAGTYPLGIFAQTGGFNINWIKITEVAGAAPAAGAPVAAAIELNSNDVVIYPNPTTGNVKVNFAGKSAKATVLNSMGQEVLSAVKLESNESIDLSNLKAGIYFLSLETQTGKTVKRIIKK